MGLCAPLALFPGSQALRENQIKSQIRLKRCLRREPYSTLKSAARLLILAIPSLPLVIAAESYCLVR